MAAIPNLNGVLESLSSISKHHVPRRNAQKFAGLMEKKEQIQEPNSLFFSRRVVALGFGSLGGLFVNSGNSLAEGNGLWITGPQPLPPPAINKIANEETGTRSFIKPGIYMANIGIKGSMIRLRKYAFDLLALGDLIGPDTLNYVKKYLRLKSTFMYYDFDKIISAALENDKQPLTDLANRLFDNVEKLEDAVNKRNLQQTNSCYQETTAVLQEVMTRMA